MSDSADIDTGSQELPTWFTQGPVLLSPVVALGQILGLLRTTGVAPYLGTEIRGKSVIIDFFGSVFTLNAAWQLIQSPCHDDPKFGASLHASTRIRGFAATLLIAAASTVVVLLVVLTVGGAGVAVNLIV